MARQDDNTLRLSSTSKRPAKRPAKHRGVRLLKPDDRHTRWRVRYRDADTGELVTKPVPSHVLDRIAPGAEGKAALAHYAADVLRDLQHRRELIARGETPHMLADLPLSDAFERYYAGHVAAKRPRTQRAYKDPCEAFVSWASSHGLRTVRQLQRGKLKEFTAWAQRQPSTRGGALSQRTVKKTLRAVAIALNWLYEAEISRLGRDDVRNGLKIGKLPKPDKRAFLSPEQISEVLKVARAHDAAAVRHEPVEPVIRFLLLSGLRHGELVTLRVGDVHLTHGYFDIRSANTKTKSGRTVKLKFAPSLAATLAERIAGQPPDARVFREHTQGSLAGALRRIHKRAPALNFSYQLLRVTCATYLANLPGAGPVYESKQLGHAIQVAEDFYVDRIDRAHSRAETLEEAMGLTAADAIIPRE